MRVTSSALAVLAWSMAGAVLAQSSTPSRDPAGKQEGKAAAATSPGGPAAPQARKAVSASGKQQEGQTEDDLYVGARMRKQPAPAAQPGGSSAGSVRQLGGGFAASFRSADAEITVPPRCDLTCRRSMVDRLQRGGYQARLSPSGASVLVQGAPGAHLPPGHPGTPGRGWCEEDCRNRLADLLGPVVNGGR